MNERGATMVSDQDIAAALESLVREASPNTTLNDVVQQLGSKLGLDLTHKVDFIRTQIHLLLRSEPPQQQPQLQPQPQPQPQPSPPPPHPHHHPSKDHFSLHQNPNYHVDPSELPPNFSVHRADEFGFPPRQPPPVTKTEAFVADGATPATAAPAAPAEASKESAQTGKKRRGGPGGLNKLCGVSPQLQAIVGQPALPRTEIVKQLWAYIRKNNLQDPSNKRKIICNDELRLVFETDCTDMFKMNKLLAKHIITLEPTKQVGQSSKKLKVGMESRTESTESGPIVILSEALAHFFGTSGREMLQSEAMSRVWEYIKVNQLADPLNSMVIHCDSKLQDLFGCESISVLGISELLLRHHLFNRS